MSMTIFEIADATARIDTVSQWGLISSEVAVKKLFSIHLQFHEMFTQLMFMFQRAQHGCMLVAPASTEEVQTHGWTFIQSRSLKIWMRFCKELDSIVPTPNRPV